MINKILLHLIILCSLSFYNIAVFNSSIAKIFPLVGVILVVIIFILHATYTTPFQIKKRFTLPIALIFAGVLSSIWFSNTHYNQNIIYSFWESREMFLYMGYFMIHLIKPDPKELERVFIFYAYVFIVFYIIQYLAYPTEIFDVGMRKDRGTIRIGLAGVTFITIAYYMLLQRFLMENKLKDFLVCVLILLVTILLGGRQMIFIMLLMTIMYLILSKRIQNRFVIYSLIAIGLVPLYFLFFNIFNEIFKQTLVNIDLGSEDIRVKAYRYFLMESFPNTMSYITGNGAPSPTSSYGRGMEIITSRFHYFISDIGIIGNYFYYGIFFLAGVLSIFWKVFTTKLSPEHIYIKYLFVSLFVMLPMGGGFAYGELIFMLTLILYLVDVSNYQQNVTSVQNTHKITIQSISD